MMVTENSLRKYSGHPPWVQGELQTCQAFITLLEDKIDDIQNIVKVFAENLEGKALVWFLNIGKHLQDWQVIKEHFVALFGVKLDLVDKFNIRKSLYQLDSESVEAFLERCILAQFAITDDDNTSWKDNMFERDVALNFLLGLRSEFQCKVITCSDKTLDGKRKKKHSHS